MSKKNREAIGQQAVNLLADQQTVRITQASQSLLLDADRVRILADQWKNVAPEIAQGHMFEQLHVVKFNLDALQKGNLDVQAYTTAARGSPHDPVDIYIQQARKKIAYQAKSCKTAALSLHQQTDKLGEDKYVGQKRLVAKGREAAAKSLAKKRIDMGGLKTAQYQDTHDNLTDELSFDNVSSGGVKRKEAMQATKIKEADRIAGEFEGKAIRAEMHRSGLEAGKTGAAIAAGMSAVDGLWRLAHGEAETGEVAAEIVVNATKGYVVSYATTAISKGVPHALLKTGVSDAAAKMLTKSNAHLAIAAGVVQSGKSVVAYLRGDIDEAKLLSEVSHTAVTGASAFYYGILGQAVIPIPVVGAFVGSTVGYFVGNMLHQSGLISLGETAAVQVARERRAHVEAMCMAAIPLIRGHRLELDRLLEQHFAERRQLLSSAFDGLENSLVSWDANAFTSHLEKVNIAFNSALPFRTFDEFDDFMRDDAQAFVL